MQISRLFGPACLAAVCFLGLPALAVNTTPAATRTPTPAVTRSPKPAVPPGPVLPVAMPAPSPSATPGCDKQVQIGEVTLCSDDMDFNFKTGDFQFPKPVHGRTADGTYRADRGYGNLHSQTVNLIGHVVIHREKTKDKSGKPVEAMTMTADQTHIESKAKYYRASGNVKVVQGPLTLTAPLVIDDESHRTLSASGGVKITKNDQTLTAPQIALDESTNVAHLTGGVHAEQKPDKTFDSAEVLYNTKTEDFKALGGVRMQFPANQARPAVLQSPSPTPTASAKPGAKPSPARSAEPTATPTATPVSM